MRILNKREKDKIKENRQKSKGDLLPAVTLFLGKLKRTQIAEFI